MGIYYFGKGKLFIADTLDKHYFNIYQKLNDEESLFAVSPVSIKSDMIERVSSTFFSRKFPQFTKWQFVDNSMFIFPGGFISKKLGCCGNWRDYLGTFFRWVFNEWGNFPSTASDLEIGLAELLVERYSKKTPRRYGEINRDYVERLNKIGVDGKVINGFVMIPGDPHLYRHSWVEIDGKCYDLISEVRAKVEGYNLAIIYNYFLKE